MSSALRCPLRIPYGVQERRRSRNMAACGMFGIVAQVTANCLTVLLSFYVYHKYRPAVSQP